MGHSFQIGGTTELLVTGVPPDVIKVLGWWSSDAFFLVLLVFTGAPHTDAH
ncbi:hypothetical protein PAXRUDRAFT_176435 [Paxillus rubicundulus Ve08.2h10]|uniref:Uncharacterized protein n=1 Tax=Paxillus rubicundulus Ve08.2h10 TaxID=930991 RepID=A0A0D0DAF1_9AGAM|nr:hypothetical protein PAXRUDRAFT_176435 [Paxillus rubicundulus Ve08.2h10]